MPPPYSIFGEREDEKQVIWPNGPNELVHRAGPPFLDNHYRGYQ